MADIRYQLLTQGGVYDYGTRQIIKRADAGWDEYQAWLSSGNVPLPPVDKIPSLDEAKKDIKRAIDDYAAGLRNKALLGTSNAEMAAWSFKFPEAVKIVGYGASTTNANIKASNPRIWAEAEHRGITARELAEKIVEKAYSFWDAEARIAGIAGRHCDAVDKLTDVRDVLFYDWQQDWPEVGGDEKNA